MQAEFTVGGLAQIIDDIRATVDYHNEHRPAKVLVSDDPEHSAWLRVGRRLLRLESHADKLARISVMLKASSKVSA